MTEEQLFNIIDDGIDNFKKNEVYQKRIEVSKKAKSDWLIFNYRKLSWKENEIEYLIEILPNFDKDEKISSWTIASAAYYDSGEGRFYINQSMAKETRLEFIADNILSLLISSYRQITSVRKEEIPLAVPSAR